MCEQLPRKKQMNKILIVSVAMSFFACSISEDDNLIGSEGRSEANISSEASNEKSSSLESFSSSEESISSSSIAGTTNCNDIDVADDEFCDVRDGEVYNKTIIGEQTWMSENLNYNSGSGSFCYDYLSENCDTYGRLYTWGEAMNGAFSSIENPSGVQGVCPEGWHLPSDAEWKMLAEYIAEQTGLSEKSEEGWSQVGMIMKSTLGWKSERNGRDDFGFAALPAGLRISNGSLDIQGNHISSDSFEGPGVRNPFEGLGNRARWWSTTEDSISTAYRWGIYYEYDSFGRYSRDKSKAYSVRCLLD